MKTLCALMGLAISLQAPAAETLQLASLEWLPFTGATLPGNGLNASVVAEVEKRLGNSVQVQYFAWKDAVAKVEADAGFAGYFPVYHTAERAQSKCHLSQPIGRSETGIGYRKDAPLAWKKLADLAAYKIGIVDGYANGADFDAAVKQGTQPVELSGTDTMNVRKLAGGKVQGIVVDRLVLRFLTMQSAARDNFVFSERLLSENTLHVCFRRSPAGKALQEAFDAELKKVDIGRLESAYLQRLEAAAR